MKKIISILAFTSLLCCSCDYLDVVPEGKATEEDIWKTTEQADKFRYYLQTYMPFRARASSTTRRRRATPISAAGSRAA